VENDRALLISKDVTHCGIPYNKEFTYVTWETGTLRERLNREFYDPFSQREQLQIVLTNNENENNQWYDTEGGNRTSDN
jgi:hypothetical protein